MEVPYECAISLLLLHWSTEGRCVIRIESEKDNIPSRAISFNKLHAFLYLLSFKITLRLVQLLTNSATYSIKQKEGLKTDMLVGRT